MNNSEKKPTFSVVIAVHDQSQELEQSLPQLLTQQYDGDYEVIVVDESSTDSSNDVLKRLKTTYQHLYTTFLPKYQFQTNKRRLALTIGVKAAKYDWVIFTDIDTLPPTETWLQELAASVSPSTELILGYYRQKKDELRLRLYEQVEQARKTISRAEHWREGKGRRWMRHLLTDSNYDLIVTPTGRGHETLRLFC
jgi:glycosyltransferase involved in cell wall biosynthesis